MLRLTLRKDAEDGPISELVLERVGAEARLTVTVDGQKSFHTLRGRELAALNEALRQVKVTVLPQSRSVGIGDCVSLAIELDGAEARCRWAGSVPVGWEELNTLASELLALGRAATHLYSLR